MIIKKIIARLKRIRYNRAISGKSLESRFSNIYKKGLWDGKGQSRSGAGSTLEATHNIREVLPVLLKEVDATALVDLGCGDFFWMKEVPLPCKYIGLDIVTEVIEENQQKYTTESRAFYHHNAVEDQLPDESDVVLCREVLFHLSFEDGIKLIEQVVNSNARYFFTTTSVELENNKDIRTGQFRNINLLLPPYNFPPFIKKIKDSDSVSKDRYLAIWDVQAIRDRKA